jgi:hypothetical protein
MKQKFKDLKVNDRVKTLHSGMATVVSYNGGTMVKLDCDVKKWNCPYFYEHELDFGEQDVDGQDLHQETLEEASENYTIDFATMSAFKLGAKWQQERSYSEEDMMDYSNYRLLIKKSLSPKEWFEKFKKK